MIKKDTLTISNKKGQFYLIAILVIISIFIIFIAINNTVFVSHKSSINDLKQEMQIEKSHTLNYITINNLTSIESESIFINFSNSYIEKIGGNKDLFFLMGDSNNIKIIGKKIINTSAYYFNGTDFVEMGNNIDINIPTINNKMQIKINNNTFNFEFYSGQNLYYLINYYNNNEVYVIYG